VIAGILSRKNSELTTVRRLLHFLIVLFVALYASLIVLAFLSDRIIFQPHPSSYRDGSFPERLQVIKLRSKEPADARIISAIYLPNPAAHYTLFLAWQC